MLDELLWDDIAPLMPENENYRRIIFDDFLWFVTRPQKYKSNRLKIEAYIHHLELKSNLNLRHVMHCSETFLSIDIERVKTHLLKDVK